ncbi:MAG: aminotransferase class I/II-fold pyridoxal phosphate-dependent enzyme [Candidatus Melainabacteria bacterium]|nr:aminotransferase class I/II-fold pyridoxal phosphate-dependent enzyme [Candidatus Melainabacteria bacterium]
MINNFHETPILNTLQHYLSKDPIRMHVPFHSGIPNNNIFPKEIYNLDVSEVSGYDVEGKDNPIFQSEKITADFFCVKHSFYLTGGASVGLIASLMTINKFGKKVILARNVHKSVINGVILSGLEPVWLDVDFLDEWGIFSEINSTKLAEIISANSDIAGCVIVSPTYEGVISNISEAAEICHSKNIPLIVDEAHGAHIYFLNNKKLYSSIQLGADIVIQSWHKSLGSLTQSGVLHLVNERFFTYNDLKRSIDLISSTSPSFLLLLSLELTRKNLFQTKGDFFNVLLNKALSFRKEMQQIKNLTVFQNDDPFKIYLRTLNISGIDFAYNLYKNYSIEIESANETGLLMLVGNNFTDEVKDKIIFAIKQSNLCRDLPGQIVMKERLSPRTGKFKLNPREAFMKGFKNKNRVDYGCEIAAPCPPGYAIDVPGMNNESYD